jgi:hypothetical protein
VYDFLVHFYFFSSKRTVTENHFVIKHNFWIYGAQYSENPNRAQSHTQRLCRENAKIFDIVIKEQDAE